MRFFASLSFAQNASPFFPPIHLTCVIPGKVRNLLLILVSNAYF
jgi:hypothetical protein